MKYSQVKLQPLKEHRFKLLDDFRFEDVEATLTRLKNTTAKDIIEATDEQLVALIQGD